MIAGVKNSVASSAKFAWIFFYPTDHTRVALHEKVLHCGSPLSSDLFRGHSDATESAMAILSLCEQTVCTSGCRK